MRLPHGRSGAIYRAATTMGAGAFDFDPMQEIL
jgi:hypothetical protein